MNGVLLLNKPMDITSNRVLQKVKRLIGASKAGHTGALDPIATGVLPLCFGEATKFAHFGLDAVKGYRVTAQLGVATETGDRTGEVCAVAPIPENLSPEIFRSYVETFIGVQDQTPSIYSALKYQGRPLYEYARKGIDVPRPTRSICIGDIQIIGYPSESGQFILEVLCSKGTYIRTLIEDLGKMIGCGAHVLELHRTRAGLFTDQDVIDLELIDAAQVQDHFIPMSCFLTGLDWYLTDDTASDLLDNGHLVALENTSQVNQLKTELPEFIQKAYDLPPVLKAYMHNQSMKLTDSSPTFGADSTHSALPVVLYSLRPEFLSSDVLQNPQGLSLEHVFLRGLAFPKENGFQPKRLIQKNQIVI